MSKPSTIIDTPGWSLGRNPSAAAHTRVLVINCGIPWQKQRRDCCRVYQFFCPKNQGKFEPLLQSLCGSSFITIRDWRAWGSTQRMKLFQLMLIAYDPKNSKNHAIPTLLCLPGLVNMEKVKTNKKSTLPKTPRVKTFFQLVPFLWHSHQSIMLKLGESWLGIFSQSTMVYLRKRTG